jgi:hypothetical protein
MAIAQVQFKTVTGYSSAILATWDSATTAGNLLIAVFGDNSTDNDPTLPSGWVKAVRGRSPSGLNVTISYKENAASQSATGNFSAIASTYCSLVVAEFSGFSGASLLDQVATSYGSGSANWSSGTTSLTTLANELCIAGFFGTSGPLMSYNNSFTSIGTGGVTNFTYAARRIVSATNAYTTTASIMSNGNYAGAIATFKETGSSSNIISKRGGNKMLLTGIGW